MSKSRQSTIPVTVNKEHLLTLGERMYVTSIELLRELVNNAYDADATEVYVTISKDKIEVEDNGSGMNEKGLAQYFNIGSPIKRQQKYSSRFNRKIIGEFGIGKFAALAVADCFSIETKKGKFLYKVSFDKDDWQRTEDWHLPVAKELASPLDINGTRVILTRLKKNVILKDAQNYLSEAVPLRAKKFSVFVNNHRLVPQTLVGKHYPIKFKTMYGEIEGEIVVALTAASVPKPGVECRVKGVLVGRELFGLGQKHAAGMSRICGSVDADFLPLTSNRSDFIRDSEEFKIFKKLLTSELQKILSKIQKEKDEKDLKRSSKTLEEVLNNIRKALKENPDLIPSTRAINKAKKGATKARGITLRKEDKSQDNEAGQDEPKEREDRGDKEKDEKLKKEEKIIPEKSFVKRIRINKLGVNCALVHLGGDQPEVISDNQFIYINQDHPLYKRFSKSRHYQFLNLMRLVTQEIALKYKSRQSPREYFEYQSRLLKDALASGIKK